MIEKKAEYISEKLVEKNLVKNKDKDVYQYGIEVLISTAINNNAFIGNRNYYENSFVEYMSFFNISDNSDFDRRISCINIFEM